MMVRVGIMVSLTRILTLTLTRSITSKQGKLISLFLKWDKDGNGRVDRAEMLAALTAEEHARSNPNPYPNPNPNPP